MENEEQLIREKMERTRESITDKLEVLENRIVGKVEQATAAVTDTASSVKDAIDDTATSVKETFDIGLQVDRHPWLMVGGAVAAGLVAGHLLQSQIRASPASTPRLDEARNFSQPTIAPQATSAPAPPPWTAPPQPSKPGLLSEFEPELVKAKELAIGVGFGILREALTAEMSPMLAGYAGEILNNITRKLGGKPMSNSELPFTNGTTANPSHPAR